VSEGHIITPDKTVRVLFGDIMQQMRGAIEADATSDAILGSCVAGGSLPHGVGNNGRVGRMDCALSSGAATACRSCNSSSTRLLSCGACICAVRVMSRAIAPRSPYSPRSATSGPWPKNRRRSRRLRQRQRAAGIHVYGRATEPLPGSLRGRGQALRCNAASIESRRHTFEPHYARLVQSLCEIRSPPASPLPTIGCHPSRQRRNTKKPQAPKKRVRKKKIGRQGCRETQHSTLPSSLLQPHNSKKKT
jgi:hypothetical protein